jgi:hypothetical protein
MISAGFGFTLFWCCFGTLLVHFWFDGPGPGLNRFLCWMHPIGVRERKGDNKMTYIAIPGNTFPVKEQLKALGAKWNAADKVWQVPAEQVQAATDIVNAQAPAAPRLATPKQFKLLKKLMAKMAKASDPNGDNAELAVRIQESLAEYGEGLTTKQMSPLIDAVIGRVGPVGPPVYNSWRSRQRNYAYYPMAQLEA